MARIPKSEMLTRLSGKIGDLVFRQCRNGTIVSRPPRKPNRGRSETQAVCNSRFAEAVEYARSVMNDPEKSSFIRHYIRMNKKLRGRSVYHFVLSSWLKGGEAEIHAILKPCSEEKSEH